MTKLVKGVFHVKQGTISVLFGCHSIIHSLLVIRSWKILYGSYPKSWEIICIFLHDIGHWGKDYLSDYEQKKEHWKLGTNVAYQLFGVKGYLLTAGHCEFSQINIREQHHPNRSRLYNPDKYSWYIAPTWWLYSNVLVEPQLQIGYETVMEAVREFQKQVKESIESGEYKVTHQIYLDLKERM